MHEMTRINQPGFEQWIGSEQSLLLSQGSGKWFGKADWTTFSGETKEGRGIGVWILLYCNATVPEIKR